MLWIAFLVLCFYALLRYIVLPQLRVLRKVLGSPVETASDSQSVLDKIGRHAAGVKTAVLGTAGAIVTTLPDASAQLHDILAEFHEFDFKMIVPPDLALKISGFIMLAMVATHVVGIVFAAKAEPRKDIS